MTIGKQLNDLRLEIGISVGALAKHGGFKGASSIQRYLHPDYNEPLRNRVAEKLATAFAKAGIDPSRLLFIGQAPSPGALLGTTDFSANLAMLVLPAIAAAKGEPEKLDHIIDRLSFCMSAALLRRSDYQGADRFDEALKQVVRVIIDKATRARDIKDSLDAMNVVARHH